MSCFVLSPKHIVTIARFSKRECFTGVAGSYITTEDELTLCVEMYNLNLQAYYARYEKAAKPFEPDSATRKLFENKKVDLPTNAGYAKLIECYLYNCSEGIAAKHPLLNDLRRLAYSALKQAVIVEYDAAPWEID